MQAGAGSGAEMVTAASSSACSTSAAASSEPMLPAAAQGRPGDLSPAQVLMPSCRPLQRPRQPDTRSALKAMASAAAPMPPCDNLPCALRFPDASHIHVDMRQTCARCPAHILSSGLQISDQVLYVLPLYVKQCIVCACAHGFAVCLAIRWCVVISVCPRLWSCMHSGFCASTGHE